MNYDVIKRNQVEFLTFRAISQFDFIDHGFSTRKGGVSQGAFSSLNLGIKTEDSPENIQENIKRFCDGVGVCAEDLVMADQVHRDSVKVVTLQDRGKPFGQGALKAVDALITNVPQIPLFTYYADCVPLLIVDPVKRAVGLAHAGWPGTQMKIGQKAIQKMLDIYGSHPEDIIVVIGPSIGQCCYEVSEDVVMKFNENFTEISTFVMAKGQGKYMLDLWQANRISLKEIGLLERNIINSNLCTGCHLQQFYSHRREAPTGRMAAVIQLRN